MSTANPISSGERAWILRQLEQGRPAAHIAREIGRDAKTIQAIARRALNPARALPRAR